MIAQTTPELTLHPYALKFPPLSEKDRAALKKDIEENGQLVPITINQAGQVLDGWHRVQICGELNVEPKIVQFADVIGEKPVGEIEFIFASNFHRRHLSDDARVAILAEFLLLESTFIHGRSKGGAPIKKRRPGNDPPPTRGGVRQRLAELSNTGTSKAARAIAIADRDPELLGEVSRGERTLSSAYRELTDAKPAPSAQTPR